MRSLFSFDEHNPTLCMLESNLQKAAKSGKLNLESFGISSSQGVYDVASNLKNYSAGIEVVLVVDTNLYKSKIKEVKGIIEAIISDFATYIKKAKTESNISHSIILLPYSSDFVGDYKSFCFSESNKIADTLSAASKTSQSKENGSGEVDAINSLVNLGNDSETEKFVFHFCSTASDSHKSNEVSTELRDLNLNYELIYFGLPNAPFEDALNSVMAVDINYAES